jgi:hypothetical protein
VLRRIERVARLLNRQDAKAPKCWFGKLMRDEKIRFWRAWGALCILVTHFVAAVIFLAPLRLGGSQIGYLRTHSFALFFIPSD